MRLPLGVAIAALAASLIVPAGAGAATEFGDSCVGNDSTNTASTYFQVSSPFDPLPDAAPITGVITKWRVNLTPGAPVFPQSLQVVRPLGPSATLIVGRATSTLGPGLNTFDTRISVQAGDRLGLFGPEPIGNVFCISPGEPNGNGYFDGEGTIGSTVPTIQFTGEIRIPVTAVLEPDADNDGFGDETQDACPQSAAVQVACPLAVVDSFPLAKRNKVVVLVATTSTTAVTVTGSAKIPNARRRARSSAQAKLPKQTKVVPPGTLTRFSLNFPKKLKSAVSGLRKGRTLKLNITATAPNLAGPATTDRAQVKLKGRKAKGK